MRRHSIPPFFAVFALLSIVGLAGCGGEDPSNESHVDLSFTDGDFNGNSFALYADADRDQSGSDNVFTLSDGSRQFTLTIDHGTIKKGDDYTINDDAVAELRESDKTWRATGGTIHVDTEFGKDYRLDVQDLTFAPDESTAALGGFRINGTIHN